MSKSIRTAISPICSARASHQVDRRLRKDEEPFLISLHFNAPHWPWEGPDDEAACRGAADSSLGGFDAGTIKTYARMVGEMDMQVGRIMKAL